MGKVYKHRPIWAVSGGIAIAVFFFAPASVFADRFQSSSYAIDASVGNAFGGSTSSTDYKLDSSGGESIIGNGSSGSYKLGQGYIAQLDKSIELRVQPSNVTAYYPLDENFGTVGHDETVSSGNATLSNAPSWAAGKIGQALLFNGSNQAGSIASSSQNNLETYTVSAWVKTTQTPAATTPIISKWDGGAGAFPYSLQLSTTGKVQFSTSDGTNAPVITGSVSVNDGTWHHIVGVRTKASSLKLFIDGTADGSVVDSTTAVTTNATAIGIASQTGSANYFSGTIDEVKLYSAALTDKQVVNNYTAENAGIAGAQTFGGLGGSSQTISTSAIVQTDAPSYTLALNENQDPTSGTNTIPPVAGTIASPTAWTEGTTHGLGFSLTSGTSLPVKWGTNPSYNYAAVPTISSSFYTRSGYSGGTKDQLTMQYRIDVAPSQAQGSYQNTITYTATMQP